MKPCILTHFTMDLWHHTLAALTVSTGWQTNLSLVSGVALPFTESVFGVTVIIGALADILCGVVTVVAKIPPFLLILTLTS